MTPAASNSIASVLVVAPARLHFGLFTFGGAGRTYGGVGAAIAEPALRLRLTPAEHFSATGPHAQRVRKFAAAWQAFHRRDALPAWSVTVEAAPPEHVGLGLGTQLGLATAAGLNAAHQLPPHALTELALCAGRGERSSVGTHAFSLGGLIVEGGKESDEVLSPLECRMPLPDDWRFVLARPATTAGLSGAAELQAFCDLPPVAPTTRQTLVNEVSERMLPALAAADFEAFSLSVTRFGRIAGLCYEQQQGGPYNGPLLNRLVATLQRQGVAGVGQSSWGPTIFGLAPSQAAAEEQIDRLTETFDTPLTLSIAAPNNTGAVITVR
ncbi:GHMP family kinase ATP-binding protein [Lignipirellula cremea]|uniref:Uncharacterized protein n=1 Tax=Lignipirellula cremea TaxID=2528010 RepID=A0A518E394_9BACT|nr:hypothetical protein [Lignipirellula cremea]QDU98513.1 hypothetical protein Pla8534_63820 [Lignipirellula cremea]